MFFVVLIPFNLFFPIERSGQEWEHLRKSIEEPLKKCIPERFKSIESVCDDFVARIERIRNRVDEVGPNFKSEIYKWAMECLCSVTVNRKVGFLDHHGLSTTSEASRLLECLSDATDAIRRCENGECDKNEIPMIYCNKYFW